MRIYLDFCAPAAWLAMKPTLALVEKYRLDPEWLPFRSVQKAIPARQQDETVGERHRRIRAIARRDTHLYYARVQGTPMHFVDPPGETELALAAMLYARPSPLRFIQGAFAAYWVEQRDLNELDTVRELLTAGGYDGDGFDPAGYLARLEEVIAEAVELGVPDAPGYLVQEQVFVGREHLPWIESLLAGA